ncbi:MAG: acyltransferase family protein, partial [Candidatus Thermoplasmatota archaeon]|nr:acyltransferase family protein [Candidatus Thermoplasmatota archaeon]
MDPSQSLGPTQTWVPPAPKASTERRHDLDWLRVILFGLLIWFHLGVFTFWLFEDGDVPLTVLFVVDVMHQWRLAALFLISGMGTAFAFRRRDVKTFLNERLIRLGVPLLFATYVLLGGLIAPVETLWLMLVPFPGADAMPYAHLWFLRNLLLYSALLAPLFAYVRINPDAGFVRAARWTVQAGGGLALITVPALILGASAILTKPWHYGEVGMWWEFPHYFLFTLFGYLASQTGAMWFERIEALRWWLLATTLPL